MSSSVQQSPDDEARRCRLLRHMTRAHEIQTSPHACHAMGRAARGAAILTIVALKAAATNGAIGAHRSRALCMRCVLAVLAGARREMVAHADSDCLTQLMPGLFRSTHRCGGRAPVLSHHGRRHTRKLQRCTRVDLTHCDTDRQIPATLVWNTTGLRAGTRETAASPRCPPCANGR